MSRGGRWFVIATEFNRPDRSASRIVIVRHVYLITSILFFFQFCWSLSGTQSGLSVSFFDPRLNDWISKPFLSFSTFRIQSCTNFEKFRNRTIKFDLLCCPHYQEHSTILFSRTLPQNLENSWGLKEWLLKFNISFPELSSRRIRPIGAKRIELDVGQSRLSFYTAFYISRHVIKP